MKAGKYWVGDLCYVMHERWDEFCRNLEYPGEMTIGETEIAFYYTAYGDGCYFDQFNNEYGVDAGLIGCIRVEDIASDPENHIDGGHIFEFAEDFGTSDCGGKLLFGHVLIDTVQEDEEEDDDYWDDEADVDDDEEEDDGENEYD